MVKTFESLITLTQVADGAQGPAADQYRVETNQEEILKFYDSEDFVFSPEKFNFWLEKDNEKVENQEGLIESIEIIGDNIPYTDLTKYIVSEFVEVESETVTENNYTNYFIQNETEDFVKPEGSYNSEIIYYEEKKHNVVYFDSENKYFSLSFEPNGYLLKDKDLKKYFSSSDIFLKIIFSIDNNLIFKLISCRFGTTIDMAQFGLYANGITASIQNSKLNFSSNGLEVLNGGFSIKRSLDNSEEEVLYFSPDTGNLTLKGDIYANDGYFNGEINVTKGNIGGFYINDKELYTGKSSESSPLRLIGSEGKIYAKNIKIGNGAEIEEYIQLGDDVLICNPSKNEGNFIVSKNIILNNNGKLNIGSIEAFGGKDKNLAYIKSTNEKWKIEANGCAHFEDIYANNVHLSNTILEVGTVQNVGSLMIFKDAWAPTKIEEKVLYFDDITSLGEKDWIYNGEKYYQVNSVEENGKKITLTESYDGSLETPVSKFGIAKETYKEEAASVNNIEGLYILENDSYIPATTYIEDTVYYKKLQPDFAFTAYGDLDSGDEKKYPFASSYSITLSDFIKGEEGLEFTKRLVLGKLDGAGINASGIGLYCDNVFLKGSLVAEGSIEGSTYYSGINTLTGVDMPNSIKDDNGKDILCFPSSKNPAESRPTGKILLWAGAESNLEEYIKTAPFRVDSFGNFYAGSGYFKGSIISEATITAAVMEAVRMRTAILEGWDKKGQTEAALKILNTNKGIAFYEDKEALIETFSIGKNGMVSEGINFINISKDQDFLRVSSRVFEASQEKNKNEKALNTFQEKNRTEYIQKIKDGTLNLTYQEILKDGDSYIEFPKAEITMKDGIILSLKENETLTNKIEITKDLTTCHTDSAFMNNITYGDIMSYEKVEDGYDLYVIGVKGG